MKKIMFMQPVKSVFCIHVIRASRMHDIYKIHGYCLEV